MNPRLNLLAGALVVSSLALGVAGAVALVNARRMVAAAACDAQACEEAAPAKDSVAPVLGKAEAARLRADRVLLPAADAVEHTGQVVCGHCKWGVGEVCHRSVLWDEATGHLVVLLPNDKLAELQEKLTPK
jgi:hypothetical protein